MDKIQRILVAVGTPGDHWSPAVAKATQIARATGAAIELFHGVDTRLYVEALDTYENGIEGFEALQSEALAPVMEQLAQKVRRHGVSVTAATDVDYPASESILRRAALVQADLIVTDCHAGSQLVPALRQFTDWELMRLSPVPVLIVKQRRLYHRPNIVAAVDPSHTFAKPLDLDVRMLVLSKMLAGALHGTLHAIHAFRADAIAECDASVSMNELPGIDLVPVAQRHLIVGDPADAIAKSAKAIPADILVLGCISRAGVQRLLIGNTAEQLLYRVPCDLLMVKPAGFMNRVERERRGPRLMLTPVCN